MYNHPTAEQLEQYSNRSLPANLFDMIEKHVISCAACREKCAGSAGRGEDYEELLSALLPDREDVAYHLSYELVAAYVGRELDEVDVQMVESHLEVCPQCWGDVESLRAFSAELSMGTAGGALKREEPGPTRNALKPYRLVRRHFKKVAGAAIAAALLLALVVLWPRSQAPAELTAGSESISGGNNNRADDKVAGGDRAEAVPSQLPNQSAPEAAAQATLLLNDGGLEITLGNQGEFGGLDHLPEALRQSVKSALAAEKIEAPQFLAELKGRPSTLSGESVDGIPFRLVSPVGEVVRAVRPTLRWVPLPGASSYRVAVADSELNEVAISEPLTATEWTVSKRLRRGAIYSWQVTAIRDGKEVVSPVLPAPQAKFKVLEQSQADELERVKRTYPRSHLLLAVLYARAGLLAESRRELQLLVRDNPGSPLARNLLRSAQS